MDDNFSKRIKSGFVILLLMIPFMSCHSAVNHDCLITNVSVVDVNTGKVLKNKTLAIDSNRISAIYDNEIVGSDSTIVIDGKGKYLIQGLWDMHAHYKWDHVELDPLLITNGITGVREMWGNMPAFVDIPKRSQQEEFLSPDVYLSGDLIDGNPPSFPVGCLVVTTPDELLSKCLPGVANDIDLIFEIKQ